MSAARFLDTNVLLYSISREPGERAKRDRARHLLDSPDIGLSAQVLQEFYVQATRATRADALAHEQAAGLVRAWTRFPVQEISGTLVLESLRIKAKHGFSYWDCAVIAAAKALGCGQLLTEDLAHGREIEGVRIVNPFV